MSAWGDLRAAISVKSWYERYTMSHFRRGIAPELLLAQVKNTMPYLFEPEHKDSPLGQLAPARVLREFAEDVAKPLDHFSYYRLCLSSHFLTCGTPVPTDVDNQIRLKLWPAEISLPVVLKMAQLVLESRHWDFTQLSKRFTYGASGSPWEGQTLSGHLGEWFTVSCGAYCALLQYKSPLADEKRKELFENIRDEVLRHSELFGTLWRAFDGLSCLQAAASISHNFGDLDRVMDMWELSVGDPLRLEFYKLTATPFDSNRNLRHMGRLWVAGELYKSAIEGSAMALENHRHFALRKPRCLRQDPAFLIPIGPFFDDWGRRVARGLATSEGAPSEQTYEIVAALKHGWERLPKTVGYGRGLRGLLDIHPELRVDGLNERARSVIETPQEVFEKKWSQEALRLMDDIPSRA